MNIPFSIERPQWRPRRPDPEHRKCGACRRTFYAGTLPHTGPEKYGPFAGSYVCADCRERMASPRPRGVPLF